LAKVNVFYVIAAVCSVLLVFYAWFMFLPQFEERSDYSFVRDIVMVLTVLLLAAAGIQMFLSIRKEEPQVKKLIEEQAEE
jgi:membrane protein DedA with SNARE-associated domain